MDAAASSIARLSAIEAVEPAAATQPLLPEAGVAVRLTASSPPAADVEDALVELIDAGLTYRADAVVVYGADRMIGTLFDINA
jgi:hypothetical protein